MYMSQYSREFAAIMEVIIGTFLETCSRKYEETVKDTEVAKLVTMDEAHKVATSDIHWKRLQLALRTLSPTEAGAASNPDLAINLTESFNVR